ncbi:hypothetical protein RHGRI_018006 [Rhododendron griersonianum]|uniref:Uncharacterized protein n=1 Tax=Rhododendron griersonianum TaxID=479676 RepID=A0AAV6K018_9ERIC|nr:hypothetical protein RHGRI_018006 [Rhododendron griersonianum]
MGSKTIAFLGLFLAIVLLITSEVTARDLAETTTSTASINFFIISSCILELKLLNRQMGLITPSIMVVAVDTEVVGMEAADAVDMEAAGTEVADGVDMEAAGTEVADAVDMEAVGTEVADAVDMEAVGTEVADAVDMEAAEVDMVAEDTEVAEEDTGVAEVDMEAVVTKKGTSFIYRC